MQHFNIGGLIAALPWSQGAGDRRRLMEAIGQELHERLGGLFALSLDAPTVARINVDQHLRWSLRLSRRLQYALGVWVGAAVDSARHGAPQALRDLVSLAYVAGEAAMIQVTVRWRRRRQPDVLVRGVLATRGECDRAPVFTLTELPLLLWARDEDRAAAVAELAAVTDRLRAVLQGCDLSAYRVDAGLPDTTVLQPADMRSEIERHLEPWIQVGRILEDGRNALVPFGLDWLTDRTELLRSGSTRTIRLRGEDQVPLLEVRFDLWQGWRYVIVTNVQLGIPAQHG
jgi:hypothetical protein